jgi:hypothetical protein
MIKSRDAIINLIGEAKYNEELEVMQKIKDDFDKKGEFVAIEGNVDTRDSNLKDIELHKGFETQCGIKGGKLSGGQK